jgi:hypothetical protein
LACNNRKRSTSRKIRPGFSITFTQCAKQYLINREIDEEEFNYIRLRAME